MSVNCRHAGQRCLLLLTPALPVSTLPLAMLAMPVLLSNLNKNMYAKAILLSNLKVSSLCAFVPCIYLSVCMYVFQSILPSTYLSVYLI